MVSMPIKPKDAICDYAGTVAFNSAGFALLNVQQHSRCNDDPDMPCERTLTHQHAVEGLFLAFWNFVPVVELAGDQARHRLAIRSGDVALGVAWKIEAAEFAEDHPEKSPTVAAGLAAPLVEIRYPDEAIKVQ